jgi:8-oxo-dGTP diphosphatase
MHRSLPSIRIAAGLIIDSAGRVLLVRKRGTQAYMQPGGKIEPHESPVQALAREIEEELGIRVAPDAPEYLGEFTAQAASENGHTVKAACFYLPLRTMLAPSRSSVLRLQKPRNRKGHANAKRRL